MTVSIDGIRLFDETTIEAGSTSREKIERTVAGLDGVLSIDLGKRGRKIVQIGTLRARSKAELEDRKSKINEFIDGQTHMLTDEQGRSFEDLRMDSAAFKNERVEGAGVAADFEIVYKQLVV